MSVFLNYNLKLKKLILKKLIVFFEVVELFYTLTVMVISQLYVFVKLIKLDTNKGKFYYR